VPDGDTPDSVIDHHLSLATGVPRRFLVRRVLPALRSSLRCEWAPVVQTPCGSYCGEPTPRTLLSLNWRSHLAAPVTRHAGALLPHPFTPHLSPERAIGGSTLCCRLASQSRYQPW